MVKGDPDLASLPEVYAQVNAAINNPRTSTSRVGDIISKDMSLSAKLLRLVNSAFYGFTFKVDTLSRAVTLVGSEQLMTLALGISVIHVFKNIPASLVDMRSFWKHSIACAMVSKLLAARVAPANQERYFVAGLLHDIGRLVIFKNLPQQAATALRRSIEGNIPLIDAEQEILGFTHASAGGLLMKTWSFPASLENMVRYHHQPDRAPGPAEAAVIHVADIVAQAIELGSSGNRHVPALSREAWTLLKMSKESLSAVVTQVDQQVDEVVSLFLPNDD